MRKVSGFCPWGLTAGAAAFGALALSIGVTMAGPNRSDKSAVSGEGSVSAERPIVILSDEAKARGGVASACTAEAFTYKNLCDVDGDCGGFGTFGICFGAGCGGEDDQKFSWNAISNSGTNDLGNPLPNTGIGTFMADNARLAGSTIVSSVSVIVRRSGADATRPGDAHARMGIWNGDPLGEIAGDVLGPSAGVELASCNFTLPNSVSFGQGQILKCDLCPPVDVGAPGDLWVVLTSDSCRLFWPWTFMPPTIGSDPVMDVVNGVQGFMEMGWDGDAGPVNAGTCCTAGGEACGPGVFCPGTTDFTAGRCTDTDAESNFGVFFADGVSFICGPGAGEDNCANLWMSVMSPANTTISLQPVQTTGVFPSTGNVGIVGNEIKYTAGGGNAVIEVKLGDWDPTDTGTQLKAFAADLDAAGYTSGLAGGLTPHLVDCTAGGATLCRNTFGGNCAFTGAPCSVAMACAPGTGTCQYGTLTCQVPTDPHLQAIFPGLSFCTAGYMGTGRSDWVFTGETALGDVDQSTLNYRWGSANQLAATDDIEPWPGDRYGGTLVLDISSDAKGTFTVGLFDSSKFVDQLNFNVPLVGLIPALVTIETGQCCDLNGAFPFVCVADTDTAAECAARGTGFTFNADKTCADACGCELNSHCDDGDPCTDEVCDVPSGSCSNPVNYDAGTTCCDSATGTRGPIDDGNVCTTDSCDGTGGGLGNGLVAHGSEPEGTICGNAAGDSCDAQDTCDGAGACVDRKQADGTLCETAVACKFRDCQAGVCTDQSPVQGEPCADDATCLALNGGRTTGSPSCDLTTNTCKCTACNIGDPNPVLGFVTVELNQASPVGCAGAGADVSLDLVLTSITKPVVGGQFSFTYNPACLQYKSVVPGAPWGFVGANSLMVNEAAGTIFIAVGDNPFSATPIEVVPFTIAHLNFTKLSGCASCNTCLVAGVNPTESMMTDCEGALNSITNALPECASTAGCDEVTITCPGDVNVNADCDFPTAIVNWNAPTAASACGNAVNVVCTPPGVAGHWNPYTGGEFPIGATGITCTATAGAGTAPASCNWTVTVNDMTALDVTVQLSPIMAGASVTRCIEFELYADCVQPPLVFEKDLVFGGAWDHIGHYTDAIKIPDSGQWVCITARDRLHSLRSCDFLACTGGAYEATFKGDPFFGGNWLIQGNLDGFRAPEFQPSYDVIDILDFGSFVGAFGKPTSANTPCGAQGVHADIDGNGLVDGLDFAFVSMNFLANSKECCCGSAATLGTTVPRTEITVRELRAMGLGDLATADLNNDGLVNMTDMEAFMAGNVPAPKAPVKGRTGGNIRSR